MVTMVDKLDQLTENLEKTWTKAITDIEKQEKYNRSTVVRFTEVEMNRMIRQTLDMSTDEFQEKFSLGSPETYFDLGAECLKRQLNRDFLEKGRSVDVESIWHIFQEKKEKYLKNAKETVRIQGIVELEPLKKYMYFSFGLKSILDISREMIQQLPSFDIQERADSMKHRIREIEKDLNTMDKDLHEDRECITTFDSEINELKEGILTIKESTNQMVDEINNKVKKEMFPRVDELEGHIGDTEKRIDGIGKRAENVANVSNIIEKEIEKLEEEYRKYFQRLDHLVSKFWNSDEKFLIVHREIFRNFGKNEEALLDTLEFGFENYNIEDANVSERMDLTIVEIEQKIKSAPQYNSVILQFWVEVLKYIYKMSYKKAKENGGYRGSVDIMWQRGIEEILNGLNRMFEDKDALIAMKIVNDYEVPLFHDVQKIWNQYQRTDHETKKRLYEKMRRDSVNPTYLKIGIPIVLSRAIMDIARKPWYHSDLAQFIWFCSVVYDETWKHYGDLLNEMVRRIQGG